MDASCSPMDETAMETGAAPSRSKSKTALNRRPSGYWKVFSGWWRGRYAALKTRPTVNEVIEWYHRNAASSWPAGQVPCLKAVLRQSKGLRPIDGLKEYFREYRKKRKQQGGLALKAGEDSSQRRSRPVKRRRGRAALKDSSDEEDADELEQEVSACSDLRSSDDDDDDEEVEDVTPSRRQRGCVTMRRSANAADEEAEAAQAAATPADAMTLASGPSGGDAAGDAVQAVFDAWHHVAPCGAVTSVAGVAALVDCQTPPQQLVANVMAPSDLACVAAGMDDPDAPFMQMQHALAAASGDPVHPAVAHGMVPIAISGSPGAASMPHASMFGACISAAAPYALYIQAVAAVRRPPSRFAASRRCGAPVSLPPLSAMSAPLTEAAGRPAAAAAPGGDAAAKAAGDTAKSEPAQLDDDHAGDCCSIGGGVPGPCDSRFGRPPYLHERTFDSYGYEYVYEQPPPYACHPPHPCCYRPPAYPVAYPYRGVSPVSYPPAPDCSTAGGATSSFSPAAPWPAMAPAIDGSAAFAQRQGSVESPSQLDVACYPHPRYPHHPGAWNPWGPADGPGLWPGALPSHYAPHDPAWARGLGRMGTCGYAPGGSPPMGCPCGACFEALRYNGSSPSNCQQQHLPSMRPPPLPHMCFPPYGSGTCQIGVAGHPARQADMWVMPVGREPHAPSEGPVEGEACSSSISEQDGRDAGRRSPCSGTSGQGSAQPAKPCTSPTAPAQPQPHWPRHPPQQLPMIPSLGHHHLHSHHPLGCYPAAVMYPSARGLPNTGSVTSLSSLAAVQEELPFMGAEMATGACKPAAAAFHVSAARRGGVAAPAHAPIADTTDADVSPFLSDAPAAPCGSDAAAAKDGEASLLSGPVDAATEPAGSDLEVAECALGLADGFGTAQAMDPDFAFAFENFMACDAPFDSLGCQ